MAISNESSPKRSVRGREVRQRTLRERIDRATQRGLRAVGLLFVTLMRALWCLCMATGRCTQLVARMLCQGVAWTTRHVLWPATLYIGIYCGVDLSALLPTSLWAYVAAPQLAQWTGLPLQNFPLARLPERDGWLPIGVAALAIAAVVFHEGGFEQLQRLKRPLLATLIAAVALGVRWPRVWFRRKPCPEPLPPTEVPPLPSGA